MDVQVESSIEIRASREAVWNAVTDPLRRPTLKSFELLSGVWPEEAARARVVMDKGTVDMTRTETVVRMIPGERLLLKAVAPEWNTVAWLDYRVQSTGPLSTLTAGVIVAYEAPEGGGVAISREDYAALTTQALAAQLEAWRADIERALHSH